MSANRMTKSQFINSLAEISGLTNKQSAAALDAMHSLVAQQLGRHGPGEVLIPGLLKLNVASKPATPEHEGINPFTKAPMMYKAKAARKVIKVRPLKALKDSI